MAKANKKSNTKITTPPPTAKPTAQWPEWLTNRRLHIGLLFFFGALLYANTLGNQYAQDDAIVITDNMFTTQGIKGIPGILKYDTFYGFFKEEGKANLVAGGRYRPLSLVMFAIERQIFGDKPMIGHLFNALWYGLTVVVFYLLLLQFFRPSSSDVGKAYFIALSASVLFAAHPIHTEAVANIKGRDEILAMLGSLAALYFSFRAYFTSKALYPILAGIVFFLGLLSKENAITFLAVAPLSFYFFTKAKTSKIVVQTLPYVAAAVIFLAIRGSILGLTSIGKASMELMNNPFLKIVNNTYVPFSAAERLATVMFTLGKYLLLLFIPHPLTHDYYPRQIGIMQWSDWQVLLSFLAYVGLVVYAVRGLKRKDPVSYGIWFYLLTLSIVSNLVFAVGTNMAERLLFMPSAGWSIALAALLWKWAGTKGKTAKKANLTTPLAVLAIVGGLFSIKTLLRNPVWKNNYTLFTTDIHTSTHSAKLQNAVAGELVTRSVDEKDAGRKQKMLTEAVGHLQEAVKIHPNYKNAYLLLGNAYNYLQNFELSIDAYQKALKVDPNYTEAENNLGITYRDAGRYYGEQKGDLAKAMFYLQKAYELRPNEYETVRLLGVANGISGQTAKAIDFFTKGTQLAPDNAGAWFDLGTAYMNAGDPVKGQEYVNKAEQIEPGIGEKRRKGQ